MSYDCFHKPVLLKETLSFFSFKKIKTFIDATLGAGGHTENFLKEHPEIKTIFAFDRDEEALKLSKKRLEIFEDKIKFFHSEFSKMKRFLKDEKASGILADLGVSSMQMDSSNRGFSFRGEGILDMRMNENEGKPAYYYLNTLSEKELGRIFREYGEEPLWKKVSFFIVSRRKKKQIKTVRDFLDILKDVFPVYRLRKKIHPLTLVFQGLRIFVNEELKELQELIDEGVSLLEPNGLFVVISFHSLEDRIVKWGFKKLEEKNEGIILTKKPVVASKNEIKINPRSRSAKLRVFQKGEG